MKASISSVVSSALDSRWRTTTDNVVSDHCRNVCVLLRSVVFAHWKRLVVPISISMYFNSCLITVWEREVFYIEGYNVVCWGDRLLRF